MTEVLGSGITLELWVERRRVNASESSADSSNYEMGDLHENSHRKFTQNLNSHSQYHDCHITSLIY